MPLAIRILTLALAIDSAAPVAAASEGYRQDEILTVAEALAGQLGMPPFKRELAQGRLAALLREPRFQAKYGALPICAVFAYQMGEGGVIIKVKRGRGVMRWNGDARAFNVLFKSVTIGAQLGGSSEWGFGLVVGLQDAQLFGGSYRGGTVSATFGGDGTHMMELTRKGGFGPAFHKVYLIGASSGASVNAGGGRLHIKVTNAFTTTPESGAAPAPVGASNQPAVPLPASNQPAAAQPPAGATN